MSQLHGDVKHSRALFQGAERESVPIQAPWAGGFWLRGSQDVAMRV